MDDSLDNVINIKLNTGRSLTPQLKRHNTPQRSSNNNSAPRTRSTPKNIQLNRLTYESQKCNQQLKQHVSKRIKQRWENDNLFGLRVFMSKKIYDEDDEEIEWKDTGIEINWQSMFSELLLEENSALLKSYLACTSSFTPSSSTTSLAYSCQYKSKTLEDCFSQWEKAEFSWIKLEKKLRNVVKASILNHPNARSFVLLIEDLLLEMDDHIEKIDSNDKSHKKSIPFIYSIPNEMQHLFLRPINFITKSRTSNFQITLINSSYHRLLLHATCQFHGRTSKSITEKNSKSGETFRVTNVSSNVSRKGKHTISLVPFILSRYSTNGDGVDISINNDFSNTNNHNNHVNNDDSFEYECITVATNSNQE